MRYLTSGRKVSVRRQAKRALLNAMTRAEKKDSPEEAYRTLLAGCNSALPWLDGTHEKLERP